MTLARISLSYLWQRRLSTALNVSLLAFGVAAVILLLLSSGQLEERVYRDARGIDLVVGAKGSPTQIILSSIYELDVPTGSISWSEAQEIARHGGVRKAIPLALGDTHAGFRIAATSHDYITHYSAQVIEGRLWHEPMEAVLGADVAASTRGRIGSTFVATHGLIGSGGEPHTAHPFRIVGVLARTGSVIDQLVLTDVASFWAAHAQQTPVESDLVAEPQPDEGRTISALLVQYASAGGAGDLPRYVNAYSDLQAASPAYETARLFSIIAVGMDLLRGFALVLMLSAALSIFIALYNGLNERRYDLAVMRTLGATREDIMSLLLFEGIMLAFVGAVLGLLLGHVLTSMLGFALRQARQEFSVTGWTWYPSELWIVGLALLVGVATALLPAWRAHEVDIAGTLARG